MKMGFISGKGNEGFVFFIGDEVAGSCLSVLSYERFSYIFPGGAIYGWC